MVYVMTKTGLTFLSILKYLNKSFMSLTGFILLLSNSVRINLHPEDISSSVCMSNGVEAITVYFLLSFCINSCLKEYKPPLLFARISIFFFFFLLYLYWFFTVYVYDVMLLIFKTIPSERCYQVNTLDPDSSTIIRLFPF